MGERPHHPQNCPLCFTGKPMYTEQQKHKCENCGGCLISIYCCYRSCDCDADDAAERGAAMVDG